jgi:hypothetical protein
MITINMIAIVMHPLQDKTEKEKYSTHGGAGYELPYAAGTHAHARLFI